MATPYPTLSTSGNLTGLNEKADAIFSDFLTSNYSQSNAHYGKVQSLPYLVQQYPNDMNGLATAVETALKTLYNVYVDEATVEVSVNSHADALSGSEAIWNINIQVDLVQGMERTSLGKAIQTVSTRITKVSDINV